MAILFITEFTGLRPDVLSAAQSNVSVPPVAQQTVTVGVASVASAAFSASTRLVRVHADVACSVQFGAAPVATATSMRLAANATEYFQVAAGDKVAVITNS